MQDQNSLVNTRKFLPLFGILFLNASSDHILKNAILVILTYQGLSLAGLSSSLAVNLSTLIFILPFFIFSAWAGKVADSYNKVMLIKYIKWCEVIIVGLASAGFYWHNPWLMLLALLAMGTHSTFFGPIKYSILPEYITKRKSLLLASGYVEFGTFVAVLFGQMLGSWFSANGALDLVMLALLLSTVSGLILSYRLDDKLPAPLATLKFNWNIFSDTLVTYRSVISSREIRNTIHSISWFWAMGAIYTTQLPLFTSEYMGGSAQVFSLMLAIFSISIGLGSLICTKLADGKINKRYVLFGAGSLSVLSLVLLLVNPHPLKIQLGLIHFCSTYFGLINCWLIFLIGLFSGFYSVTCYNQLQLIAPAGTLSRIVAVNNILNAVYMLVAAISCSLLLIFVSLWWLFVLFIFANLLFVAWYWWENFRVQFKMA